LFSLFCFKLTMAISSEAGDGLFDPPERSETKD